MANEHSIGTLIETLNAKAQAAGCDVRAEHITLEQGYGDLCGVALVGSDDARARAAKFVETYFRKHIAPRRSLSAQYSYREPTELEVIRNSANSGELIVLRRMHDFSQKESRAAGRVFNVTAIGLVYWPCND